MGLFMLVGVILILTIGILSLMRWKEDVHKIFLILYSSIGLLYFCVVPILNVPDEPNHLARAYEISEGYLVSDKRDGVGGRELPQNLYLDLEQPRMNEVLEKWDETLSDTREYKEFWNTSLYVPISYLPQAVGIAFVRCFTEKVVLLIYAGRLANFLTVLIVTYFAIQMAPVGKYPLLLTALLPMNLFEAVSLAPDALVTALSGALLSFVLYMRYGMDKKMCLRHYILMYTMAVFLGLLKIVYVPLCLLLFLIPQKRFGGREAYFFHAVILGALVAVTSLSWLHISSAYLYPIRNTNSQGQMEFILTQPISYLKIWGYTLKQNFAFYRDTLWGRYLGFLNVFVHPLVGWGYLGIAIFCVLGERKKKLFQFGYVRVVCGMLGLCVCALIFCSLYVQWSDYLSPEIMGVQGRYFLPCAAMFGICLQPVISGKRRWVPQRMGMELGLLMFALHIIVIRTLITAYFL